MDSAGLADVLNQITGSWRPGTAATHADLALARERLAALANGISPEAIHASYGIRSPAAINNRPAIDALVKSVAPEQTLTHFPYVRSVTNINPTDMSNTAGMKVDKTLGPFIDNVGVCIGLTSFLCQRRFQSQAAPWATSDISMVHHQQVRHFRQEASGLLPQRSASRCFLRALSACRSQAQR